MHVNHKTGNYGKEWFWRFLVIRHQIERPEKPQTRTHNNLPVVRSLSGHDAAFGELREEHGLGVLRRCAVLATDK